MDNKIINKQIKKHNIDKEVYEKILEISEQYFLDDNEIAKKRKGAIGAIIEEIAKDITPTR